MSNYYHIVLRVDQEANEAWSSLEVIERWGKLFSMSVMITSFLKGERNTSAELKVVDELIEKLDVKAS